MALTNITNAAEKDIAKLRELIEACNPPLEGKLPDETIIEGALIFMTMLIANPTIPAMLALIGAFNVATHHENRDELDKNINHHLDKIIEMGKSRNAQI